MAKDTKYDKNDPRNRYTGERIADLVPDVVPDEDKGKHLQQDKNYEDEIYSAAQLELHDNTDMNVFTVDGIPSRWEHNKLRSTFHFDPFRDPCTEPKPFVVPVRFVHDYSEIIKYATENCEMRTIGNYRARNQSRQDLDLHDAELMDVKRATGGTDVASMSNVELLKKRVKPDGSFKVLKNEEPILQPLFKMFDYLECDVHQSRLHIQRLGQVTPAHIDQQMRYARPGWRKTWLDAGADKNPLKLRRFLVMLQDWDYGHVWQFGNHYYQGYKAGEAVTYDWCNMPHGTANFGYQPRVTFQFTGFVSDKIQDLINTCGDNTIEVRLDDL